LQKVGKIKAKLDRNGKEFKDCLSKYLSKKPLDTMKICTICHVSKDMHFNYKLYRRKDRFTRVSCREHCNDCVYMATKKTIISKETNGI
jgi:hypothetical protein